MSTRTVERIESVTYAMWIALACVVVLTMTGCAQRAGAVARPKYGDSTTPIGPDKSLFKKSQPKFQ